MKNLNIAFIWHFHQPNYQQNTVSEFLLPWARLHASKDYLDMLKRMDKFPGLRLNFDFSPVLINALQKYSRGIFDIHAKLLIKDVKELSEEDKIFILNNYFDCNYKNMVLKRKVFTELYNKRVNASNLTTSMFTDQQYCDIMANFTLCWIDRSFICDYPSLKELFEKEKNYTLDDRKEIFEIQLNIIKRILAEYKKYQDEGKIEISISPYYHAILPLLLNFQNKEIKDFENLPLDYFKKEYAQLQIDKAIEKYVEVFDKKPKGMWLSEQCICPETVKLLSQNGFLWTIADEGILSKTLKKEFIRDFEGNLENPFNLNTNYITQGKNPLNILFSDSFFANLLNFGYGNYDSKQCANDLYERIKIIQSKLQNSPLENHILTIALDGENCWETYIDDGNEFLDTLYGLISSDETLKTVCVSDFIQNNKAHKLLNLESGSWINRNFDLWIGEATKNVAWLYQASVIRDFEEFCANTKKLKLTFEERSVLDEKIKDAQCEILVAQGSDWYWWYGEPNESKSDGVFDYLFRSHLINVYKILGLEVPSYLLVSLTAAKTRPLRNPIKEINPELTCETLSDDWENAGLIFVPDSPVSNVTRIVKNIYFGYSKENLYFRFELNKNLSKQLRAEFDNKIAIYFTNDIDTYYSPVRFANKNENIYPIVKNQFAKEVIFSLDNLENIKMRFNKACDFGLWSRIAPVDSKIVSKNDIIELRLSFVDLDLNEISKSASFCIIETTNGMINEVYPQDTLIEIK